MPRKKLEDLEQEKPSVEPKADAEVVVPASSTGATKKVKLDLEVDTLSLIHISEPTRPNEIA